MVRLTFSTFDLTILHSERPKLYGVLAILSAKGLSFTTAPEGQVIEHLPQHVVSCDPLCFPHILYNGIP